MSLQHWKYWVTLLYDRDICWIKPGTECKEHKTVYKNLGFLLQHYTVGTNFNTLTNRFDGQREQHLDSFTVSKKKTNTGALIMTSEKTFTFSITKEECTFWLTVH